jgi:Terminase DNA packaging enzyme
MKTDEKLSAEFGIEPIDKTEIITKDGVVINETTNKIEDDYEVTRNNLRLILSQGQQALMKALDVANQSEHPRAFEVVGNLMKQLADVNQQLLDLHQQKQKLDAPKDGAKKEVTNNNAIFVGSTADLNKMLKNMTKGDA